MASHEISAALDLNESGEGAALSDNELMVAVAAADTRAFSLLMGRHVRGMTALARRITLNFHDADEVVQEAFLRVWTNAPRWRVDGPAQFRTWLQRVVTNLAIDYCRKPKMAPLDDAGDPPDPAQSAETLLQKGDEAQCVRQAMLELTELQRAAVALYYFEDMKAAQIANVLNKSTGSIEVLLSRARRAMQSHLADKGVIGPKGGHHDH